MSFMKETKAIKSCSKHNLPDDLWLEILCRLPAKSLVRFRCVSKSWQSMVNDPNFCRLHLNKFKNNSHETHYFVAQYEYGTEYKENYIVRSSDTFKRTARLTSLDIAGLDKEWYVLCLMDGLVLLKYHDHAPTDELMLWNPSIRKVRALPPSPVVISEGMKTIDLGFGFSSLVNDYKIVRLVRQGESSLHAVAIYTVGTSLWKTVKFDGKGMSNWCWQFECSMWRTVCFRGCLYFIATNLNTEDEELVSFDLSNEVFASAVAPIAYETIGVDLILKGVTLVLGGCLLGLVYLFPEEGCIWVSEINADGFDFTKWTKLFIFISFVPHFDRLDYVDSVPNFLYLGKNGDVLLQWNCNWVTAYSLETEEERTLLKSSRLNMAMVCGYIESLALLNG